jgi:hypothetical protein
MLFQFIDCNYLVSVSRKHDCTDVKLIALLLGLITAALGRRDLQGAVRSGDEGLVEAGW